MCSFLDDIIKFEDFSFDNISIDKKSHPNILIYEISYKNLTGPKSLRIKFNNIDGFIRISNGARYLVLFGLDLISCYLQ